jgi:hypothetical protein
MAKVRLGRILRVFGTYFESPYRPIVDRSHAEWMRSAPEAPLCEGIDVFILQASITREFLLGVAAITVMQLSISTDQQAQMNAMGRSGDLRSTQDYMKSYLERRECFFDLHRNVWARCSEIPSTSRASFIRPAEPLTAQTPQKLHVNFLHKRLDSDIPRPRA